jgi:hypothetical protein
MTVDARVENSRSCGHTCSAWDTGSPNYADAEDLVQEAWLRWWVRVNPSPVCGPADDGGRRLGLDKLRSPRTGASPITGSGCPSRW